MRKFNFDNLAELTENISFSGSILGLDFNSFAADLFLFDEGASDPVNIFSAAKDNPPPLSQTAYGTEGGDAVNLIGSTIDVYYALGGDDIVTFTMENNYSDILIDGGSGDDIFNLDNASYGRFPFVLYSENEFGGTFDITNNVTTGDYAGITIANFEGLNMTGGGDADLLRGGESPDELNDGGFYDLPDDFGYGTFGLGGNDALYGMGGDDVLIGTGGNDILDGGAGNDVITSGGDHTVDYITENDNQSYTYESHATMRGGAGDDTLNSYGDDTLEGGEGDDTLINHANIALAIYSSADAADYIFTEIASGEYTVQAIGGTGEGTDTLSGIETIRLGGINGTDYDLGTLANYGIIVNGTVNDDFLEGTTGNDIFIGGGGNDVIHGRAGIDIAVYSSGSELDYRVIDLGNGDAYVRALYGYVDGVDLLTGVETLRFGGLDGTDFDIMTLAMAGDVTGTNGDDSLTATGGDIVLGLAGNDIITGTNLSQAEIYAGAGNDNVGVGSITSGFIYGGAGDDTLSTSSANYSEIDGGAGNDTLNIGFTRGSTYRGGTGDDEFSFTLEGLGISNLIGGEGVDVLRISTNYHVYDAVNQFGGTIDITNNVTAGSYNELTNFSGFESLIVTGGGLTDTLRGGSGNDVLEDGGFYSYDLWDYSAYGEGGSDALYGMAGDDILIGTGGNDILDGGDGNDVITSGSNYAKGDAIWSESIFNNYIVTSTAEMRGGAGDDILRSHGADTLEGGQGDDTLINNANTAIAIYSSANVGHYQIAETAPGEYVITAVGGTGEGVDTLTGIEFVRLGGINGTDYEIASLVTNGTITLTTGDDVYTGPATDVIVNGLGGHDVIDGGAGNNTLNGNAGDDTLISQGNDILNGGSGNDIVQMGGNVFDAATVTDGGADIDTISFSTLAQLPSGNIFLVLDLNSQAYSMRDGGTVLYVDDFTNFEHATGSEFGDLLQGDAAANVLSGLGGDDSLQGRAGDDIIHGGDGTDTAIYSSANIADYEVVETSPGEYIVTTLGTSGEGTDTLTSIEFLRLGGTSYDIKTLVSAGTIMLTAGNDVYSGPSADFIVNALAGDDIIDGGAGNNTLNGDAGNDTLISLGNDILNGGTGNDIVEMGGNVFDAATATDGGLGFDTISFSTLSQFPSGNLFLVLDLQGQAYSVRDGGTVLYVDQFLSFENATGSESGDLLQGDAGANVLSGLDGDDNLQGRDGADVIDGGAGADTLNGGIGADTASYASALAGVTAIMGDTSLNTGDAAGDSYISIENITGSDFDDILGGDGNANIIDGGAGIDIASYAYAASAIVFDGLGLVAASGDIVDDTFLNIEGIGGSVFNDRLFGANEASIFYGGAGNDRLFGRNGDDQLFGEDGDDIILAGRDNDLLDGGAGNDQLRGNEGDDTIFGGDGNDVLAGGAGADAMDGGAGIDRVEYTYGTNAGVTASLGDASINTGDAAGDTYVNIENLYGTTFNDTLYGDAGNNRIDGRLGDDMLFGGDGNDYLIGGAGNDVMNGEAGNDLFLGQAGADIYQFDAAHGTDRIVVFTQGEDLIEFTEGVFDFSGLTITQDGANVNIVSSEGTIIANNSLVTDFTAADFIFAPAPAQEPLDETFAQYEVDLMAMDFDALI